MPRGSAKAPPGRITYVDGRYLRHAQAGVHVEDRGFQFADGVYEVWGIVAGALRDEEGHLARLERSLREIEVPMPMSRAALRTVLLETVRRNRVSDGILYLQVTRGVAKRDHPVPAVAPRPTVVVTARSVDTGAILRRRREGVGVCLMPDNRWARCDIKSTGLLPNLLAKTAARRAGAYEAWLVDRDGFVTEGASTTAWIVTADGTLVTRPLSEAILPGVTRAEILRALEMAQVKFAERAFSAKEARGAREAFLTAATAGIIPVIAVDGGPVGAGRPGPVTRRVQELYAAWSAAGEAIAG